MQSLYYMKWNVHYNRLILDCLLKKLKSRCHNTLLGQRSLYLGVLALRSLINSCLKSTGTVLDCIFIYANKHLQLLDDLNLFGFKAHPLSITIFEGPPPHSNILELGLTSRMYIHYKKITK